MKHRITAFIAMLSCTIGLFMAPATLAHAEEQTAGFKTSDETVRLQIYTTANFYDNKGSIKLTVGNDTHTLSKDTVLSENLTDKTTVTFFGQMYIPENNLECRIYYVSCVPEQETQWTATVDTGENLKECFIVQTICPEDWTKEEDIKTMQPTGILAWFVDTTQVSYTTNEILDIVSKEIVSQEKSMVNSGYSAYTPPEPPPPADPMVMVISVAAVALIIAIVICFVLIKRTSAKLKEALRSEHLEEEAQIFQERKAQEGETLKEQLDSELIDYSDSFTVQEVPVTHIDYGKMFIPEKKEEKTEQKTIAEKAKHSHAFRTVSPEALKTPEQKEDAAPTDPSPVQGIKAEVTRTDTAKKQAPAQTDKSRKAPEFPAPAQKDSHGPAADTQPTHNGSSVLSRVSLYNANNAPRYQ